MRFALSVALLLGVATTPASAGAEGDFAIANRAFAEGDFASALRSYQRTLSEELYANALCNLGNACFRLGKLGPAALIYERALALEPRHPDAAANLKLTRDKSGARVLDQPWWEIALLWLHPGTATAVALGAAWVFMLLGTSMVWRKKRGGGRRCCALGVLLAAGYAAAVYWEHSRREEVAIVVAERAVVRSEPAEHSAAGAPVPAGSEVRVLGEHGGWTYCVLSDGQRGWLPAAAIEFLFPRGKCGAHTPLPSLAIAAAVSAEATPADWRAAITRKPGPFTKLRVATFDYAFGWSGLTAAEAVATSEISADGKCALTLSAKTTGVVRTMWKMDALATSAFDPVTLHPLRLTQTETYKKMTVNTVVDFLADGPAQHRTTEPPSAGEPEARKFRFSDVHDPNSAALFIRSQPLAQGDSVKLCVFPGNAPYLATVTVTGREKLRAAGHEWNAIRCDLQLNGIEADYSLSKHRKFKTATAWISDDADRLLLKVEAEVFVGSVWAELQSVSYLGKK